MATCLIILTGTGSLILNYKEGEVNKSLIANNDGLIHLEQTVTNVSYTTITGDLQATSACFTIAAIPYNCWNISWDMNDLVGYKFTSVNIDGNDIGFQNIDFPNSKLGLAAVINSLNDDRIKITQGFINATSSPYNITMIVKTTSSVAPIFKIQGPDSNDTLYLIGDPASCSNPGYIEFNTYQDIPQTL